MTLAEIIEEGEQAEQSYRDAKPFTAAEIGAGDWCHRFYVQHGPTLLAVAKAAVEAERLTAIFQRHYITAPPDADSTAWTQRAWAASGEADDAIEKLFAAVRGEGKETTNG